MKRRFFYALVVIFAIVQGSATAACSYSGGATDKDKEHKSAIKYANDVESFNKLIAGDKPVLVDFYAVWCPPCRELSPIIDEVATDISEKVDIAKINIDKNGKTTAKFNIKNIPTMILFVDGKEVWRYVGVLTAEEIKEAIKAQTEE